MAKFESKRQTRSEKYQYLICECVFSYEYLIQFSNKDSIASHLNPFAYDERVLDLYDELKERFWILANEHCTDKQLYVLRMYADGYTQQEISDKLGTNQSSTTKCLNGNIDYQGKKKVYGGAIPKMKKVIAEDVRTQEILKEIDELITERY